MFFLGAPLVTAEQPIEYELRGYGSHHAALILTGVGKDTLTVTPSSDGLSIRISGVEVTYSQHGSERELSLVSSVNQVKRGGFNDLVINLKQPSEITVTPSAHDLQIFIRGKVEAAQMEARVPADESRLMQLNQEITKLKTELSSKEAELAKLTGAAVSR